MLLYSQVYPCTIVTQLSIQLNLKSHIDHDLDATPLNTNDITKLNKNQKYFFGCIFYLETDIDVLIIFVFHIRLLPSTYNKIDNR